MLVGNLNDYKRDQDLLFQQLWEREKVMTAAQVEEFVLQAGKAGYKIDDLLRLLNSGMSVPDLARTVLSKLPEYRNSSQT